MRNTRPPANSIAGGRFLFGKPTWLRLHRYVGLSVAALLLVQALTGAMLVYRAELAVLIDPVGQQRQSETGSISAGAVIGAAMRAMPGHDPRRLFAPHDAKGVWFVELAGGQGAATRYATIDPGNARLLRQGDIWAFPLEAALQLHYRLMTGRTGTAIIALEGVCLLWLMASGLAFWWPRRGQLRPSLAIRWRLAARLWLRQLHRTIGVIVTPLLAFMAITGLLLAVPDLLQSGAPSSPSPPAAPLRVDEGLALAARLMPGSQLRDVRIDGARLIVNFHAPDYNPRAVDRLVVDTDSMAVVKRVEAEENPALWIDVLPLHTGESAGALGQIVTVTGALLLVLLLLSGPYVWWRARIGGNRR